MTPTHPRALLTVEDLRELIFRLNAEGKTVAASAITNLSAEVEDLRQQVSLLTEQGLSQKRRAIAAESRCEGLEGALMVLCDVAELAEPESRYDLAAPIREARALLTATRTTGD